MKIQYLGTAAAEGWPALFCNCEACEKARKLGGKNIRTRSQSIIDDRLLIDMPADTYFHALQYHIDFPAIEHIVITHSHEDHFYPLDMILKAAPYAFNGKAKNLHIYGNDVVIKMLKQAMATSGIDDIEKYIIPVEVKPFVPFQAGEYTVTPLLADHMQNETCLLYIIEKDGKRLLYAHDTGIFPKQTWDYIKNMHFDAISIDCTFVLISNERGHLGISNVKDVKEELYKIGCADLNTKFIINHFSHNGKALHEELVKEADKIGCLTAFDGMTVAF